MAKHAQLDGLLKHLQSHTALRALKVHLKKAFQEASKTKPHRRLGERTKATFARHLALMRRATSVSLMQNESDPEYFLNMSDVPGPPTPVDCEPTTKCALAPTSCNRLRDHFLKIYAGLADRKRELDSQLSDVQHKCQ